MGRPREHDDSTRQALLAAAEHLVDTEGPAALSVRRVADEVGTSTRAVYSVFGSKAGLLEALAVRLFELLSQAIDAVPTTDDPRADLVAASTAGFRAVALAHPSLYNLVFLRVVPDLVLGPAFNAVAADTFARLEALVVRLGDGSGHGRALAMPPGEAAQAVHALTEGLATMELRGALGPPAAGEAAWRRALEALLQGLSIRPA